MLAVVSMTGVPGGLRSGVSNTRINGVREKVAVSIALACKLSWVNTVAFRVIRRMLSALFSVVEPLTELDVRVGRGDPSMHLPADL